MTVRPDGSIETYAYDPAGNPVQDFAYAFDRVGNITAIVDNAPITAMHAFSTSQSFAYDNLDRLITSNVFGSYRYDKAGNIIHKEGVDFFYEDPEHPYCPTRGTDGYQATYDVNGNLATKRDKNGVYWRYEYDAENMLVKVYKGPAAGEEVLVEEYTYGADGKRKEKVSYQDGQTVVTGYIYLGENVIYEAGPKNKLLIWGTAQLLAEKEGGEVTYNHPDHLGSTSVKTDGSGRVVAFVGNKPYGEFYAQMGADAARDEDFTDASQVAAGSDVLVDTAQGIVHANYTVAACNEVLYSVNYQSSATGSGYTEVKSYSFTLVPQDYRRELKVEADIIAVFSTGYIRLELVKPDGGREIIKEAAVQGTLLTIATTNITGTVSLEGRRPGKYRIAVSIKGTGFIIFPWNNILKVTLTSKRVYRPGVLIATPMMVPFDAVQVALRGSAFAPSGTSVVWSVSADGGFTWITLNGSVALAEPTRQIILRAVLNATSTATPVIDSYRLMAYSVSPLDSGLRFTGKETDRGTGLVYFGARYYDPEVGRWTTVDPAGDGMNWYAYC
ncbi:MAG: RHS repeat-associated core domain-containing protein, partial [Firmicutes bacterium]|nr:RHS repeat-associated core domain-containing protein [Bacillota bacterium]